MIKAITNTEEQKTLQPPCLGVSSKGSVVLFTTITGNYGKGVQVANLKNDSCSGLGHYSTVWDTDKFKPYNGQLILENI